MWLLEKINTTLFIIRADVTNIILENTTLKELFETKQAGLKADQEVLNKLFSLMVEFNETCEIVPRPAKVRKLMRNFMKH